MANETTEPQTDNSAAQENAPIAPAEQNNSAPAEPQAPAAPAVDAAKLAERERAVEEKEAHAAEIMAKAEKVLATAEDAANKAHALVTDDAEAKLQASREEKVNVVKAQIASAYGDEDLGEATEFTPQHTLTNVANGHTIVFEEGITYTVPAVLAEDLQRRDKDYAQYKTNLHVREEVFKNAGRISGGGK